MIASDQLKDLKVLLLDLNLSIGKVNQKKLMQQLVCKAHDLLRVKNVSVFMYNKWNVNNRLDIHQSIDKHYDVKWLAMDVVDNYNQYPDIQYCAEEDSLCHLVKLKCNHHYYGVMVIAYHDYEKINHDLLEYFGRLLSEFIKKEYDYRKEKYLRKRQQYFFELTTRLHAVHETTEILKDMYVTIQKLYPFFEFSLLMSRDYEIADLPIELIEYSGEMVPSPGTMAFIDNEIKIEVQHDKNEMQVYSPLAGNQGVYGVVKIMIPHIVEQEEMEWDMITQLSNMTGMAIERTTLFQSSNKQVFNLQAINNASKALNSKLEREDIISTVKKYISETSEADDCAIVLYNAEVDGGAEKSYELLKESAACFFTENGSQLITYIYHELNIKGEAILSGNFQSRYKKSPYHSLMAIPMWSTKTIFGFIMIAHPMPYHFTFDCFRFIQSFIQHASLAFKNSMLQEQLHELATTDYLTKLRSRNYLDNKVTEHMKRGSGGTLVLFDVDDFKKINDTFGHYIGDNVLKDIAEIMIASLKGISRIAARWGGEEFALYFPDMGNGEVLQIADEIRYNVFLKTDPQVTLSCGIAAWKISSLPISITNLFINADEALYEAKSLGKNRTIQKRLY